MTITTFNDAHVPPAGTPPLPFKKVFDLQPDIAWDKGKAVLWLLDKLVFPMSLEPAGGPGAAGGGGIEGAGGRNGRAGAGSADVAAAAAAALAANGAAGLGGGGGGEDEEDEEDEGGGSGRFFTIFIGDDKTDEVRDSGEEDSSAALCITSPWYMKHDTPTLAPSYPTKNRGRLVLPPSSPICWT